MRFTVSRQRFLEGILIANRAIGSKSSNPILLDYKFELTARGLEITSSNSVMSIFTTIPMKEGDAGVIRNVSYGSVLVNAQHFTNIFRKLAGDEVTFEVIDNSLVRMFDGITKISLTCTPGEEYPDINMDKGLNAFEVPAKDFRDLVSQTAFAALDKDTRPLLTAINLKGEGGKLTATATDSARLSRKAVEIDPQVRINCNVPAKTLTEVAALLDGVEEIEISSTNEKIFCEFNNTLISGRLILGDYPVSPRIIPQGFSYFLEVESSVILTAVDRVSVLAADRAPVVKLAMSDESIVVSSGSDMIGSGSEKINPIGYTGDKLSIAFNPNFVTQSIKALGCETVVFSFLGEMKPFVIKNPKDDSVIELITPIRTK